MFCDGPDFVVEKLKEFETKTISLGFEHLTFYYLIYH